MHSTVILWLDRGSIDYNAKRYRNNLDCGSSGLGPRMTPLDNIGIDDEEHECNKALF